MFLAASAMPCSSGGGTPRIVDYCQCCQCCQFQFSISNIGIDNWQHSHTGNIEQNKVENTKRSAPPKNVSWENTAD